VVDELQRRRPLFRRRGALGKHGLADDFRLLPPGVPHNIANASDKIARVLWRIAHGHNTVIDPVAQPFDPVERGSE